MNMWPLLIGAGRLGVIWISNYKARRLFLTLVTIAFMMYHYNIELDKFKKREGIQTK